MNQPKARAIGVFHQVALRGNVARHVDNALDAPEYKTGFGLFQCAAALIENNVFALNRTWPVIFDRSAIVSCVNNLTPQGTPIPGFDNGQGRAADTYFPAAEEAMILSML